MKMRRCTLSLAALLAVLATLSHDPVTAADEWGDEEVNDQDEGEDLEEDFENVDQPKNMIEKEAERQRLQLEEDAPKDAGEFSFVEDGDGEENTFGESAEESLPLEDADAEPVMEAEDLEIADDGGAEPTETIEPSAEQPDATQTSGKSVVIGGHVLQTTDEEGVDFDHSSLNPDNEHIIPNVKEFVDKSPTFKKEEEEKKKKKAEQKEIAKRANNIDVYEADKKVFLEAKEKNEGRFHEEVENAEADLQPPKAPTWWQRLRHWGSRKLDALVERFGSGPK